MNKVWLGLVLAFGFLVMLFDFQVLGMYQSGGDTQNYLDAIQFVRTGERPTEGQRPLYLNVRMMKPVYPLIGAALEPTMGAFNAILVTSMFFYFATIILFFFCLRSMKFGLPWAAAGTMWFIGSYPMLKYGFALLTDIGGYCFIALSVLLVLQGLKTKRLSWFAYAGLALGIGSLTKETGVFGVFFLLGALLIQIKDLGWRFALKAGIVSLACLAAIFVPSQAILIRIMDYNYFKFWQFATVSGDRYLTTFVGIYGISFHILWIYAIFGFFVWLKDKTQRFWAALWLIGVPMLFWNSYVTRYAFIWFVAVIPLALMGVQYLMQVASLKSQELRPWVGATLIVLPVLISFGLIMFIGHGSFFKALGFGTFALH